MKTKLLLLALTFCSFLSINAQVTSVAIVGSGVGGWSNLAPGQIDVHQMNSLDGENWILNQLTITATSGSCEIKFRANNEWTINWGSTSFPSGVATNNSQNIVCFPGTYDVTFNSTTGVFNFVGGPVIPVVKLVGTAVCSPNGLILSTTDLINFSVSGATLRTGMAQFEVDGVLKGSSSFPIGVLSNNGFIPVDGNLYTSISVNITTNDFNFSAPVTFDTIDLVRTNTSNSGNNSSVVAVNQMSTTDGIIYKLYGVMLANDELKFTRDNGLTTYGNASWPNGFSTLGGNNILAVAGTYNVIFNRSTLEYNFEELSIAIVGSGVGGWPTGSATEIDQYTLTTTDGMTYSVDGINFEDGEVKFRANNSWELNWGGTSFNSPLVPNGPNISTVAGINNVTFNRMLGQAVITPNLSTSTFATASFRVSPNPCNTTWNFISTKDEIVSIQVTDMLGKIVAKSDTTFIAASALSNGVYFAKVASVRASQIIKVIKN